MAKINEKRLRELLDNILSWGCEHDSEFMQCMVEASGMTKEEAKELDVEEYIEDEGEEEDDPYEKTGYEDEAEDLLMTIAEALDMPYEDEDPASYDEWNYISLLHDYNDGRGDEWIETFEEKGLDPELLAKYKKLISYGDEDEEED